MVLLDLLEGLMIQREELRSAIKEPGQLSVTMDGMIMQLK